MPNVAAATTYASTSANPYDPKERKDYSRSKPLNGGIANVLDMINDYMIYDEFDMHRIWDCEEKLNLAFPFDLL